MPSVQFGKEKISMLFENFPFSDKNIKIDLLHSVSDKINN